MDLDFTAASWKKSTRCDNSGPNCIEVAFVEGGVGIRDSKSGKTLSFTTDEWDAFAAGAKDGEFDL